MKWVIRGFVILAVLAVLSRAINGSPTENKVKLLVATDVAATKTSQAAKTHAPTSIAGALDLEVTPARAGAPSSGTTWTPSTIRSQQNDTTQPQHKPTHYCGPTEKLNSRCTTDPNQQVNPACDPSMFDPNRKIGSTSGSFDVDPNKKINASTQNDPYNQRC
jgi:hypothetical protein